MDARIVAFGTKAETLERLGLLVRSATVLPLYRFAVRQWRLQRDRVIRGLHAEEWAAAPLIVRSSACNEDGFAGSQAGRYLSIPHVHLADGFETAVEKVIGSFGSGSDGDQVLVQPMLRSVSASGVAFSRDPNSGAPYIVVNYGRDGDTSAVTGGRDGDLATHVHWKYADPPADRLVGPVVALVHELEQLLNHDDLDIEFAFDAEGHLYLFQVRPLVVRDKAALQTDDHRRVLQQIARRIETGTRPDPFIHGRRTVYGIMPDWNPAEIIGVRPRPLALSLYRELVTDAVWAYQRNNYGYKNLRSCPLLVHFHGLPYVDVRVSFNSFVPADIDEGLADRLVNYYIDRLLAAPHLHDKVEFEIIFSCYTPTLPAAINGLQAYGFPERDLHTISESLRRLTNNIIHNKRGLWRADLDKLGTLERRRTRLLDSDVDVVTRIYWLLEDCKRYGSLPFAGLARAGFIAVQLLRSLVEIGVLDKDGYGAFMSNLNSVGTQIARDRVSLDRASFLARYGHLRPGTYDILSPRYDEAPDLYFDWDSEFAPKDRIETPFALSLDQMRAISSLLQEHGIENDIVSFLDFLKAGIEGREYSKFVFTRNLSDAVSLFRILGEQYGFSPDDLSYCDIGVVRELYVSSADPRDLLAASIEQGRVRYAVTRQVLLPPIITGPNDVWSFAMPDNEPNFITQKAVTASVAPHTARDRLAGAIVAIPNADPGFDWLFSHPIAGLVTAYGGVNSHMAIRAGELGLPAVIGVGQAMYDKWSRAGVLSIDCANRLVTVIR